jgi:hypothetical protein
MTPRPDASASGPAARANTARAIPAGLAACAPRLPFFPVFVGEILRGAGEARGAAPPCLPLRPCEVYR